MTLQRFRNMALRACLTGTVALTGCMVFVGCASSGSRLTSPETIMNPYDQTFGGPVWAVVPLRNESGTTLADSMVLTDKLIQQADQIDGLTVVPLNRTIEAMHRLEMSYPQSPKDLKALAEEMQVDAVLVGSITSYEPYDPPKYGLGLALYALPGEMATKGEQSINPQRLIYQPTDYSYFERIQEADSPVSVIGTTLDGRNHRVQAELQSYAEGRMRQPSALGWETYLASMDLFTEFGSWSALRQLMDREWVRLSGVNTRGRWVYGERGG